MLGCSYYMRYERLITIVLKCRTQIQKNLKVRKSEISISDIFLCLVKIT